MGATGHLVQAAFFGVNWKKSWPVICIWLYLQDEPFIDFGVSIWLHTIELTLANIYLLYLHTFTSMVIDEPSFLSLYLSAEQIDLLAHNLDGTRGGGS